MSKLFLLQPEIVWAGLVNDSWDDVYPLHTIPTKSNTVGSATPSEALGGYTVLFGDTAGSDNRGRGRIRKTSVFSQTLFVGRSSQGTNDGEIDIEPDVHITVIALRQVWSKPQYVIPPAVAGDPAIIYKDGDEAFASHGSGTEFAPTANTGPAVAATIDSVTSVITVDFDAGNSYSNPGGVGITDYLWDFADGTVTVGDEDEETATVTFPAGFRYVSLTVTDANGGTHTAYCPVLADDPANSLCVDVSQVESESNGQAGQRFSFRIMSDLPRSTYPDGTLCLYWDEPSDAADRTNVKFQGWHHTDRASYEFGRTGQLRDTVLECLDVAGKLDTLPGQSQIIEHKETPENWTQMYRPGVYLFVDYLLRWHSTALEVADYLVPEFDANYDFIVRESGADTILRQVAEQARAIVPDHIFTCNELGQLQMKADPMIQATGNRTATVQANLSGKIASLSLVHTRPPRVHWIRAGAVVEGWTPIPIMGDVQYPVVVTAEAMDSDTSIAVEALTVAIPSGTIIYLVGAGNILLAWATTSADAAIDDTTIAVDALDDPILTFDTLVVVLNEQIGENVPTVFCLSPGLTPGQGEQQITVNNKICQNQGGLNSAIGNLYARLNATYSVIDITLAAGVDVDIQPAAMTWIQMGVLPERYVPQRGLSLFTDNPRLLPLEVTKRHTYSAQGRVTTITVRGEVETAGRLGVTITGDEI